MAPLRGGTVDARAERGLATTSGARDCFHHHCVWSGIWGAQHIDGFMAVAEDLIQRNPPKQAYRPHRSLCAAPVGTGRQRLLGSLCWVALRNLMCNILADACFRLRTDTRQDALAPLPLESPLLQDQSRITFRFTGFHLFRDFPPQGTSSTRSPTAHHRAVSDACHCKVGTVASRYASHRVLAAVIDPTTSHCGHLKVAAHRISVLLQHKLRQAALGI